MTQQQEQQQDNRVLGVRIVNLHCQGEGCIEFYILDEILRSEGMYNTIHSDSRHCTICLIHILNYVICLDRKSISSVGPIRYQRD